MFSTHAGPHDAAQGLLTCAHINLVLAAAKRVRHPVALATEMAILAPGVADVLPGCYVDRIDLERGCVVLPDDRGGWTSVALGRHAMELVAHVVDGRTTGQLLVDDHGAPLALDRDASDYAVELLGHADERCRGFEWSLNRLRVSALANLSLGGVPDDLLLAVSGRGPSGPSERRFAGQAWVGAYWEHLLGFDAAYGRASALVDRVRAGLVDNSFQAYAPLDLAS